VCEDGPIDHGDSVCLVSHIAPGFTDKSHFVVSGQTQSILRRKQCMP